MSISLAYFVLFWWKEEVIYEKHIIILTQLMRLIDYCVLRFLSWFSDWSLGQLRTTNLFFFIYLYYLLLFLSVCILVFYNIMLMTNELIMRIDEKWQIQEFQNFGGWVGVIEILVLSWRGVLFWYPFTHTLCFCSECRKYRLTWYIDFIESIWVLCSPNFQKQTLDPPLNIFIFDVADFTIVFTLWLGQGCNDVQWGA